MPRSRFGGDPDAAGGGSPERFEVAAHYADEAMNLLLVEDGRDSADLALDLLQESVLASPADEQLPSPDADGAVVALGLDHDDAWRADRDMVDVLVAAWHPPVMQDEPLLLLSRSRLAPSVSSPSAPMSQART